MLCENLKIPLWQFDNGWSHEASYQIYFWGAEFEILQNITSTY